MKKTSPVVIVALDVPDRRTAMETARKLDPSLCRLKIGLQLFVAAGPAVVEDVMSLGFDVFLDLKFHDIPATVRGAVRSAAGLGVWMTNVHASGGPDMLLAAAEAIREAAHRSTPAPVLVGVTVLTSMDAAAMEATGLPSSPAEQVARLASISKSCGLDGVVCSGLEAADMLETFGPGFTLVVPGVRFPGGDVNDQARVVTPAFAASAGASYIVVGRPITGAAEPVKALKLFDSAFREPSSSPGTFK